MALTAEKLDSTPCHCCGLTHREHPEPLDLQGRCHPDGPLHVVYADGELRFSCAVCGRSVTVLSVLAAPSARLAWLSKPRVRKAEGETHYTPRCHPGGSRAQYRLGEVKLSCETCRRPYARCKVADE